jgi:hypothetical protein
MRSMISSITLSIPTLINAETKPGSGMLLFKIPLLLLTARYMQTSEYTTKTPPQTNEYISKSFRRTLLTPQTKSFEEDVYNAIKN